MGAGDVFLPVQTAVAIAVRIPLGCGLVAEEGLFPDVRQAVVIGVCQHGDVEGGVDDGGGGGGVGDDEPVEPAQVGLQVGASEEADGLIGGEHGDVGRDVAPEVGERRGIALD